MMVKMKNTSCDASHITDLERLDFKMCYTDGRG
jgi:hypothetical protein